MTEPRTSQDLQMEIRQKTSEKSGSPATKKLMFTLQPLSRTMQALVNNFNKSIAPHEVQFDAFWGLICLNLRLSFSSLDKLERTVAWLSRLRRVVELFNRCFDICEELNEARLTVVEVMGEDVLVPPSAFH